MPRSCFLPDIECSAEERAEAERLCRAEGVDPRGRTTWTWTYRDGSKRSIDREEWVAYLDAARALMRARWPRDGAIEIRLGSGLQRQPTWSTASRRLD